MNFYDMRRALGSTLKNEGKEGRAAYYSLYFTEEFRPTRNSVYYEFCVTENNSDNFNIYGKDRQKGAELSRSQSRAAIATSHLTELVEVSWQISVSASTDFLLSPSGRKTRPRTPSSWWIARSWLDT